MRLESPSSGKGWGDSPTLEGHNHVGNLLRKSNRREMNQGHASRYESGGVASRMV